MKKSRAHRTEEVRSPLQEIWPPKWFFSYSDLATLMMTFFIILSTMLTLRIPLTALADKKIQAVLAQEKLPLEEIRAITDKERKVLREIEELDYKQLESVSRLRSIKDFVETIRAYIREKLLDDLITVEEGAWSVRVTPLAPLLFGKGKDVLRPEARQFLDKITDFVKGQPSYIRIEGHTDSTPIHTPLFASNWELSVARANSVMRYFTERHAIPQERVMAIGYGEYRPVAPNDTEAHRAQNRRVMIEITPIPKEEPAAETPEPAKKTLPEITPGG